MFSNSVCIMAQSISLVFYILNLYPTPQIVSIY